MHRRAIHALIAATLLAGVSLSGPLAAQTVPTGAGQDIATGQPTGPGDGFYPETLVREQQPQPFPFVRESDVLWKTTLWRCIDLHELFNQYIYFPILQDDPSGKKNLAYTLWEAIERDELPIFEDDELLIPLDNSRFVSELTRPDTMVLEIGYDEADNEVFQTIIRPNLFDAEDIYRYALRDTWFVGKADTRLDSRRLALAPLKPRYRQMANGDELDLGTLPLFWVPMQHPAVRRLLASTTAYFDNGNMALQPSWDHVFIAQMYNAYTTRYSNRYNRSILDYLTGEDAIRESDAIEQRVFDLGDDMWEY